MLDLALEIAAELIRRPSVTPEDGGCQDYIEALLQPYGFQRIRIDRGGVTNSIFLRQGERAGCLAFAGHTDVVPTGPLIDWPHDPFAAVVENGMLHGRGAQDMKGGIACWLAATMRLLRDGVPLPSMQLLITSDEEGESIDGTVHLVDHLQRQGMLPDAAVVGEPSSQHSVGDTVRRGRRGVLQIRIRFGGKQGHSAYPQDADNAIHRAIPALLRVIGLDWGKPAPGFPPTTCQITNLNGGTGASNVIPGHCDALLDIRYNPANTADEIESMIRKACNGVHVELKFDRVAEAFSTADGPFLDGVTRAIREAVGTEPRLDTGGGTSDGRFLAKAGVAVAEIGLTNSTIHQIGECVALEELAALSAIYATLIRDFEVNG